MVAYVTGSCSRAEKSDFETHCLACEECRSVLATILLILRSPVEEKGEKVFRVS
jgi:predicted metal-binding protein